MKTCLMLRHCCTSWLTEALQDLKDYFDCEPRESLRSSLFLTGMEREKEERKLKGFVNEVEIATGELQT